MNIYYRSLQIKILNHGIIEHRFGSLSFFGHNCIACKMCILGPQPGIEPGPLAMKAWSLNHWTAREVPLVSYFRRIKINLGLLVRMYRVAIPPTISSDRGTHFLGKIIWMLMKTLEFLGIITVPITLNPQARLQELMDKKKTVFKRNKN